DDDAWPQPQPAQVQDRDPNSHREPDHRRHRAGELERELEVRGDVVERDDERDLQAVLAAHTPVSPSRRGCPRPQSTPTRFEPARRVGKSSHISGLRLAGAPRAPGYSALLALKINLRIGAAEVEGMRRVIARWWLVGAVLLTAVLLFA